MFDPESYKEGAIDKIMTMCHSVSLEDIEIIGDIIQDTLTHYKKEIVNAIGVDIATGVTDRVNITLSKMMTA